MGKRELELAAARANVALDLVCKPFMLDPSLPPAGVDKLQHYMRKFGPQAERMLKDPNNFLAQRGKPIGCAFQYHEGSKVFNSMQAHHLLTWAVLKHGVPAQMKLKEVFLRRYLAEGANLGLQPELLASVAEVGLPQEEAKAVLDETHKDFDEIQETFESQLADSHRKGNGVPAFYFPDGTTFSGGQEARTFDQAIARALAKSA